jgi:xanthine/uracil permease
MSRLFLIIYTLAATVLAGIGVIAALTTGRVDVTSIIIAAAAGAILAIPAAWVVSRRLENL